MKKAIGAFLTGLLLSVAAAAIYVTFRRQVSASSDEGQEQANTPSEATQERRRQREKRRRSRGGLLDLNACTLRDLAALEGLDRESAQRVIDNRPYRNKLDLVSRMVVPEPTYVLFSHFVTVTDPSEPVKIA